jgi:thiol-disulfide isomerase/thioredoxin
MNQYSQTSKNLIIIGWVALSILLSFASFILVQWLTIEGAAIINFISLFFAFSISSRFSKYPFIGITVLILFLDGLLLSDNALDLFHLIQDSFCLLGVSVMVLFKKKHYKSFIALFLVSTVYLFFIKSYYLDQLNYNFTDKSDLSVLIENRNFLIGHNKEHPTFNLDTVYLVNFSFRNCLPCRKKKPVLKALATEFGNSPFKIIQIHSFESMEIFREDYQFDYTKPYHDSLNYLAKTFKIYGAPTEIIFDKNGKVARRLDGYTSDAEDSYLQNTSKLIKKLIHEK